MLELDESQVDTAVPADPPNVQLTFPVGTTPPKPLTIAVKVIIDPSEPEPTPVRTTAGVTWAIMTLAEVTVATPL